MTIAVEIPVITWQSCYDQSWKGLITDDSFSHPAKFAPGLVKRILAYGIERGWWKRGNTLGDPFGGIAGGGIMAGYEGMSWVGCELEPRFVELGNKNIELNRRYFDAGVTVRLMQGDSRRFAEIVEGVVTSPPYGETLNHGGGPATDEDKRRGKGATPGQIGALPMGQVEGVVSSPPFTSDQPCASQSRLNGNIAGSAKRESGMMAPGNIANLKSGTVDGIISSPPYADSVKGSHDEKETAAESHAARSDPGQGGSLGRSQRFGGYGVSAGNIGNLKEGGLDGVATSPPYESIIHGRNGIDQSKLTGNRAGKNTQAKAEGYGHAPNNIGNSAGETYWSAMAIVYRQCFLAIKPGGYLACVVKDFVKGGKRVPLCDQTLQLLIALGFEPVERIHAMLVKETKYDGLFAPMTKKTSRKSFFRRLAEKNGSPAIDWEEVLIVRKTK